MRILIIQTPNVIGTLLNLPGKEIPLSLCYLAAYVRERGHQPYILDLDFYGGIEPYLSRTLQDFQPDLVGISSYTTNVARAAEIAASIKARLPDAPVLLGGFHASALPERTMREFPVFDLLAVGEGEQTITEVADRLEAGQSLSGIAGLMIRDGDDLPMGPPRPLTDDLDALPFPARDLLPVTKYIPDPGNFFRLPSTGILFSRGCPFHCTFCSKSVFKDTIRYRKPERVTAEMRECRDRWGITDFRFEDEGPTLNRKRMGELCETILAEQLDVTWNCFSRVDTIDESDLRLMKRAGCYHVTYGIESGSEQSLEKIDKRLTLDQARRIVAATKKLGIECKANFIIGFPWETQNDIDKTLRFAFAINPDLATFNVYKPLPGSRLYDQLDADGKLRHTRWEDYFATSEFLLFESNFTDDEMRRILKRTILRFHLRPRFVWQRFVRLLRHPRREALTIWYGLKIIAANLFR